MSNRSLYAASLMLVLFCTICLSQAAITPNFTKLDQVFAQTGKPLPGGVRKYSWPRSDLHVSIAGVAVEPGLALGSWAAFQETGKDQGVMVMGDLVLLGSEVNPVISELQKGNLEIQAVHNHLLNEVPEVMYVHYEGQGMPDAIADCLKAALARTKTPAPAPPKPPATLPPDEERAFNAIQDTLGQKGSMAGRVLQISVPRAETIQDGGMEIPPAMGMSESMNFQQSGGSVFSTGDFVLLASEVNPVIKELRAHGIEVTALHHHMLNDSPRLFFMHFWATGTPEQVAGGLKAALAKVNIKK